MSALVRVVLTVLALLTVLAPARASAAPGFTETCEQALPKEQIDDLVDRMRAIGAEGPCALGRVDTSMFRTQIEWRRDGDVLTVLLGPRGCVVEPSHEGEDLAYYAAPEFAELCPEALAGVRAFVGEPREELVPVVRGQAPELSSEADGIGLADPLVLASAAWLAALILAALAGLGAWRELRAAPASAREDARRWGLAMAGLFVVALVPRFVAVASLGNWYGPFLPAEGLGELRFGASSAVLQALVRALSPWTVGVAFGLVRVTGALAVPLIVLVVRRLGGSLSAGVVAGVLLALAPIAVRLSASSSEHVLAGTLALAAWAVWLRSATEVSVIPRLLSASLVLLAILTRVDCWPQLCLIPLWTIFAKPSPAAPDVRWQPLPRRLGDAAFFWLSWALIGVYGWFQVVLPSNHPGPEAEGIRYTARVLFSQLWVATSEPPHWISPVCLACVVLGLVAALLAKRWGLVGAALLSWALIFVPLGRNLTHDGLTGARYFVLALPVLVVVAAQLGDAAEGWLRGPRARLRRPLLGAGAVALAVLGTLAARPGWRHEYTFQAEYLFLAEALDERELDGCTLWFVRPRQPTSEPDLDCCLAPDRSPLGLVAPQLRFRSMPNDREPSDEQGCHLYYRGSLCDIDPALAPRVPRGVARIHAQCERLRTRGGEEVLERREVTTDNLNERWRQPPVVELFGRFDSDAPSESRTRDDLRGGSR
ncbi:hypothetical protein ENSA5_25010 [Enhygromyxa salina]|uniref:Glycosyltransferase RgtA/B/C/D-like domain-containing protein n=1 Tax=Enhygromyxa salina TaxID=215803 RepID=A0A2S9YAY1_9BACT|nr:hypothetical protein [Enhygromyxa salina]PRQ02265.1 hypothetical protein ENSA5_25010 [Enhygromyxa salina]